MPEKLVRYVGALAADLIASGMNAVRRNATRLAQDARLCLEGGSATTAAGLAILSIEESGKIPVLRELAVAASPTDLKVAWRRFRSHTAKNAMWPVLSLAAQGARRLGEFRDLFLQDAEHTVLLDQLKQLSQYVDIYAADRWSEPDQVIDLELATTLVGTAELLVPRRETTTREIELWVKLVGPELGKPMERMEAGLSA